MGTGVAISRSDVGGLADAPLTAGVVVFVPDERSAELSAQAGTALAHASFTVGEAELRALGATVAVIGADGRFPLPAVAGRHLVCLADSFPDHQAGPPHSVVGCAFAELPTPELTVSFGEGGVEVG